jgi:plasmid stabilization system protein ParE
MKQVRWTPTALRGLARVREFLGREDGSVAQLAVHRIRRATEMLRRHPELGRPCEDDEFPNLREVVAPFGRGAYVLRYRIDDDAVVVLRVWHSREERS